MAIEWRAPTGKWRTQSLFFETVRETDQPPPFTWKEKDFTYKGNTYIALKPIYLSYDHLPGFEYEFAQEQLGGWAHWQALLASKLLGPHLREWQEELEIKQRSKAIKCMLDTAKTSFNSAKYLADKGYLQQRGRPSKDELAREAKVRNKVREDLEEDMERIGLQLVK